jgi:uncharacterized membrane protein HdeD (DUF308 family)
MFRLIKIVLNISAAILYLFGGIATVVVGILVHNLDTRDQEAIAKWPSFVVAGACVIILGFFPTMTVWLMTRDFYPIKVLVTKIFNMESGQKLEENAKIVKMVNIYFSNFKTKPRITKQCSFFRVI